MTVILISGNRPPLIAHTQQLHNLKITDRLCLYMNQKGKLKLALTADKGFLYGESVFSTWSLWTPPTLTCKIVEHGSCSHRICCLL